MVLLTTLDWQVESSDAVASIAVHDGGPYPQGEGRFASSQSQTRESKLDLVRCE